LFLLFNYQLAAVFIVVSATGSRTFWYYDYP